MHCVDCSTYELALRGSEFELCARWKNVDYLAEQRPLAAVHFTAFSIHGSIGPVLTQYCHSR